MLVLPTTVLIMHAGPYNYTIPVIQMLVLAVSILAAVMVDGDVEG